MDEQDVYTPQEDMNNNAPVTVSKGPFYGLVLAVLGILFIISSFFIKPPKLDTTGTVTYASTMKQEGKIAYQQIKVSFIYNGGTYETECRVTDKRYSKHDSIQFRVIGGDPTNITTDPGGSAKYVVMFFGIVFLIGGVLLFLQIIPYEPIEAFVLNFSGSLGALSRKRSAEDDGERAQKPSRSSGFSAIGGFLDKLPKKDNDRTEDDMEDRIKRRKEASKSKKKQTSIYHSDNILDLYEDDEEDEDDEE